MTEIFLDNIYLALLLPLWIFLIIMVGRFFSVYVNKQVIYLLTLISSAFGALLCGGALWKLPVDKILQTDLPFVKINDFIINWGIHIDKTSLIFAFVLFIISFFIQIFSISYMQNEKKIYRFFALMNFFNFSMASLFFSPNLFQTYFFWELAGVASYLLINFEYFKTEKSKASQKVFIINRIGDTALIGAIIMCSYFIYTYAPNKNLTTLSYIDMNAISTLVYAYASNPLFEIICLMFITGALVKSAQFPFYTWLQDAMEAKLPISALLHSSTLVAAGTFLTLRLLSFYTLEDTLLKIIAILGIITALVCSISACAQTNPKKALAYSTSAQFGLIYFGIGMLNIKGAVAFFIAHAFIKSLLFISLPPKNQKWNYISFIIFLISGLSLSGLIFSGMLAKELLNTNIGTPELIILSIISFLTAFYIIRIALVVYQNNSLEKKQIPILELFSYGGLLVLNIIFYAYLHKNTQYRIAEPFWAALTGWIFIYILYIKNAFWKIPILYPIALNGFYIDKFYTKICSTIYSKLCYLCNFFDNKILNNYKLITITTSLGVNCFKFIENKIMNGTIYFITKNFKRLSLVNFRAQTGNIQSYNTYAFIIITLILLCLILGYTAIIIYLGG